MKILLLFYLFIFQLTTFARIGETPDQCQKRYRYHISEEKIRYDIFKREYLKDGLKIIIFFHKQKAAKIIYQKRTEGFTNPPLDSDEIRILLNANTQGYSWEELDLWKLTMETDDELKSKDYTTMMAKGLWWIRTDKNAMAHYNKWYEYLIIESDDFPKINEEKLEGF